MDTTLLFTTIISNRIRLAAKDRDEERSIALIIADRLKAPDMLLSATPDKAVAEKHFGLIKDIIAHARVDLAYEENLQKMAENLVNLYKL